MTIFEIILMLAVGLCFLLIWFLAKIIEHLQNAVIGILDREIERLEK